MAYVYTPEQVRHLVLVGDITPNGVPFDSGPTAGLEWFRLVRLTHHRERDIRDAKAWLRTQRKVASIGLAVVSEEACG